MEVGKMRKDLKWIGSVIVNGLLLLGLAGLLAAYLVVVTDLPSRIYTTAQQEYLSYNRARSITQTEPTLAIVEAEDQAEPAMLPVRESRIRATLAARHEEREGVSVTVYDLEFNSEYLVTYTGQEASATAAIFFPFPGNLETLHEVSFLVDGEEPTEAQYSLQGIGWYTELEAGEEHRIAISYQADGANSFTYSLAQGQRSDVLDVTVTVLGLEGSEVPRTSLPTTETVANYGGETFTWNYTGLIPNRDIGLNLPTHLSFAQRVAQLHGDFRLLAVLAPFLIGLFLASLAGVLHLSGMSLRLESYLLVGCGLALFYPALTFLSGLVDVSLAAALALLVTSSLLLVFLGLTAGWRQTWWRVGLLLIIFLGAFSLGMLTPWRELLLTSGGLLLVGTFMVLYARRPPTPEPEPVQLPEAEPASALEAEPVSPPVEVTPEPIKRHCPHCGRALADDHDFCPGCGQDTSRLRHCAKCGHEQFVAPELEPAYCVHCGQLVK
jgi:hypothetical protein